MLRNIPVIGYILDFFANRAYQKKTRRLLSDFDVMRERLYTDHRTAESIKRRLEDGSYDGPNEKMHLEKILQGMWDEYRLPVPARIDELRKYMPSLANKLTNMHLDVRRSLTWTADPRDYYLIMEAEKDE